MHFIIIIKHIKFEQTCFLIEFSNFEGYMDAIIVASCMKNNSMIDYMSTCPRYFEGFSITEMFEIDYCVHSPLITNVLKNY